MDEETLARCWFPPQRDPTEPKPPPQLLGVDRATLFADGVTLRVRFRGKGESATAYEGYVVETSTAACVVPVERPLKREAARTAWRHASRELTTHLAHPLGARVLLAPAGCPLAVLSWTVT